MAKQQIFSVARMAKQVSSLGQRNEEWKKEKKKEKKKFMYKISLLKTT